MKKIVIMLALVTTMVFSCKQDSKSGMDFIEAERLESVKNRDKSKKSTSNVSKSIYTKYVYANSKGENIVIQNSFPKGGMKYKDLKGNEYVYAVFWTRIINKNTNPVELKINFPPNSYEIQDLPGKYYKILIPSDIMTLDKIPLFNYGLKDLDSFFDNNIDKSSLLKRTIKPKESNGFYVVILRLIGGDKYGVLRTELSLKGQNLFYKIRDKEIQCGSIEIK
ncbi:hypothetical protein [Flavobacterium notoginsengisoli]|uniref:hypothetical protein n=1 Tax=Flavobacterium notoginsengisoli TaxID=1478199 RepID=UPI00363835C7